MREQSTNVLILGSGAREHALARACARSASIGTLFVAPGNPGCKAVARLAPINPADELKRQHLEKQWAHTAALDHFRKKKDEEITELRINPRRNA